MSEMLQKCFNPDEVAKINKVSYSGPLAVLKEKYHLDMTDVVRNSRLFDMDRGLSKEEKLSRLQQGRSSTGRRSMKELAPSTLKGTTMMSKQ